MGIFNKIKKMLKNNAVNEDEEEVKDTELTEVFDKDIGEDESDVENEEDEFDDDDDDEEDESSDDDDEEEDESDEYDDGEVDEPDEDDGEEEDESDEDDDGEVDEPDEDDGEEEDESDEDDDEEEDESDEDEVTEEEKEDFKKSIKVYEKGLTKARHGFVSKLVNLTSKYNKITEDYFEELEEILIMADIGVNTVMDFMDRLRDRVKKEGVSDPSELKEMIVDELFIIYVDDEVLSNKINYNEDGPTVILFIGVNGVGKTTTIGKIANKLKDEGKKVLLVGADTFRAGAVNQLKEWSKKVDVGFFGKEESDPASVVYDGIEKAKEENYDVVLVDTAGRLQNKVNLMKELEKMNKVIDGLIEGGATETLLVVDATTGQNGISQAKSFKEITNITGIVLTKLDGTAKGGIVLAIKESVGIPVKYIGLGETKDDLQVFDIEKYIYGLFKDMM